MLGNESADSFVLPDLIACGIYDLLLHKKPLRADANPRVDEYGANLNKQHDERARRAAEGGDAQATTKPALELGPYAGVYENPEMGRIVISQSGESLTFAFGNITSPLVPLPGDAFRITFMPGNMARLTFKVGPDAVVTALSVMDQTFSKVKPG